MPAPVSKVILDTGCYFVRGDSGTKRRKIMPGKYQLFRIILLLSLCFSYSAGGNHSLSQRKAILNTVRQQIKAEHHLDVIFVVRYLKVKKGWAWVHLLPQSRDGKNHYEDISALLHQNSNVWYIAEIPCAEEEDPACITNPRYFLDLHKRFPGIPMEIFPKEE